MKQRKQHRIAISAVFFLYGLCFASWASRIPDFQQKFALGEAALGNLLFALPIGSLLAIPLAGYLVHVFGSRRVVVYAGLFYGLVLATLGWLDSVYLLFGALLLFGMGGNLINIALNTQAIAVEDMYQRSIMNAFHGLWSLAGFFGAGLGALMIAYDFLPQTHYLLVLALVLLILIFSKSRLIQDQNERQESGKAFGKPDGLIIKVGLVAFCGMLCEGCMFDWSGVYFKDVIRAQPGLVALGYVSFMAAMASGRFIADKVANRIGKYNMLRLSGTLICAGLLIAVMLPSLVPAIIGFLLVGVGTAAVVPLSFSIAGRSQTLAPSIALAMVSSISFFGFLLGPPLIGYIASWLDLKASFAIVAGVGAMIAVLVTLSKKELKAL